MQLSDAEKSAIDRDNRQYNTATGLSFSDLLQEQVLDPIENAAVGINADARDVNGIALPGIVVTRDTTTGPGTSLVFAWRTFKYWKNAATLVVASAGSLTLSASATNYVELDVPTGVVSFNTSGFTANRYPLFQVTTGAGSYTDNNVVQQSTPYTLFGPGGVNGTLLSAAGQTKELSAQLGTIATAAGANEFLVSVPSSIAAGSKLTKARFVTKDALTASDTNYVKFGLVNKQTGAGTQVLVDDTLAANSTKVTGGSALVAYAGRDLTLATLTVGTERDVTGGHTLQFLATVVGTLANTLRSSQLILEFTFTN